MSSSEGGGDACTERGIPTLAAEAPPCQQVGEHRDTIQLQEAVPAAENGDAVVQELATAFDLEAIPLDSVPAAKFHKQIHQFAFDVVCGICHESWPGMRLNSRHECQKCVSYRPRRTHFCHENSTMPAFDVPECLSKLSIVEESLISVISPMIEVFRAICLDACATVARQMQTSRCCERGCLKR